MNFMKYKEQLANPEWQKKRLQVFERDGFCCNLCSATDTELHVHHKEYHKGKKAWEYDLSNFMTVCKYCHEILEALKSAKATALSVGKFIHPSGVITFSVVARIGKEILIFIFDYIGKMKLKISLSEDELIRLNNILQLSKKM